MAAFVPKWDPLSLIEIMREVVATTQQRATVTQQSYNQARREIGFGHTPRADKLAARYGMEWSALVRVIGAEELRARTIARATHSREREVLTTAEAVFALQAVARRLATEEITPTIYEHERQAINAEVRRRYRHGSAAVPLPSVDVLREKFEFAEIMDAAGLRYAERAAQRLMPRASAVLLFLEHCGFLPGQQDLRWFARHHRIQLVAEERERHLHATDTARATWKRDGRWFPASRRRRRLLAGRNWLPRGSPALRRARAAFPAARKAGYTEREIRDAVRRAFSLLPPGQTLTQERYRMLSTEHGLPSPSVIQRSSKQTGTGFGALVREVAAERAAAIRDAQPSLG
ncbi:MAG TPA: hypothetical protein VLJ42_01030 [Solirubrobacteraceae bacterium]|nr:hypothetical protein [Solirubrobacteraceae bacterium]